MLKRIEVNLQRQKLIAYQNGKKIFECDCFTGDDETPTRPGRYFIYWKHANHVSSKYHSPMPYSMFFDKGRAIHGSSHGRANVLIRHLAKRARLDKLDNYVAESVFKIGSHGCVNLNQEDAAQLFRWAETGTPVFIQ